MTKTTSRAILVPLTFVNHLGVPVSTSPARPKRASVAKGARHEGWVAVGVPPHLSAQAQTASPERIRKKPFFSFAAAMDCVRLAQRSGWVACDVQERKFE